MNRFDDRYLNYGDVYDIIMQAKTVDQSMNVLHLPYVEMPEWIPVTERLPNEDGRYLVFRQKNGKIFIDGWMVGRGWLFFETIDAWMPLPEPYHPEEGQE